MPPLARTMPGDAPDETPSTAQVRVTARAKVNLALHVTGRRADGYHLLDTLVAFPDIGDRIAVRAAERLTLRVTGPFADSLPSVSADEGQGNNLVLRAARALSRHCEVARGATIELDKQLPVASGIGGGSADAAATLRALVRAWHVSVSEADLHEIAAGLGADVPMCLASRPLQARGIGDQLTEIGALPAAGVVLVNPRVAVATPAVFGALAQRDNPPLPALPKLPDTAALVDYLSRTRNDLEVPAREVAPVIGEVLAALESLPGLRLARMSGSGATCFGLFDELAAAGSAAAALQRRHPRWWIRAATLD